MVNRKVYVNEPKSLKLIILALKKSLPNESVLLP